MGSNTPNGLPYPVGTDRVMDGDDAIKALALALDTGSGWVAIPYASGYIAPAALGALQYRKLGALLFIRGGVTNAGGSLPAANVTVATLQAAARPLVVHSVMASPQNPATVQARLNLDPTGSVSLITSGGASPYVGCATAYLVG
jgi:hypothetical protein